jgi:HAD superfamily hydrolase (TIGR01484 family)
MFYVALATDYDGTLARQGRVDSATIDALQRIRTSGRKLILVTGRDLADLRLVFDRFELFDRVVAENGAILFDPANRQETALADVPNPQFVARLKDRGVTPLTVGRAIVASWEPNETAILETIHELGLELHIIFNKGAVMVLPSNVNKAWGLQHALKSMSISAHNVVGIGDAENDQAFLSVCGCAVAVANAVPAVKDRADLVVADHGAGVIELATLLTSSDLQMPDVRLPRVQPTLGLSPDKSPLCVSPFDTTLIAGASGSGKSTVVAALLEQIRDLGFQFCVIDPEGDYVEFPEAMVIGTAKQEPTIPEIMRWFTTPEASIVINLLAIDPAERPRFVSGLLPQIANLRAETGRPHWIVLDEAHHCLPAEWEHVPGTLPQELKGTIGVTVHPEAVAKGFLQLVSLVVGVGGAGQDVIDTFCRITGRNSIGRVEADPHLLRVLLRDGTVRAVAPVKPKQKQQRHLRKYAEGELGPDKSFYFRGPEAALNLQAQNLSMFRHVAAGIDERTWVYHLRRHEYSAWFRNAIKDEELAAEADRVEADMSLSAADSRQRIIEMVERRYTAPAKAGGR